MKETSIEAYHSILEGINSKQQEVLEVFIKNNRPLSNEDVKIILGWEINRITPRVGELEKAKLIRIVGEKISRSGRRCETRALFNYKPSLFD